MNNKQMESENTRRMYRTPGNLEKSREKNAIFISPTNTLLHELSKCLGAYSLRKYGDLKFSKSIIQGLKWVEEEFNELMKEFPRDKSDFVTEAVPVEEVNRRVDLVRLSDDQRFEFETDKKIKKENSCTIYLGLEK